MENIYNDFSKTKKNIRNYALLAFFSFLLSLQFANAQCTNYQVYESFNNSSFPPSGWSQNSVSVGTNSPRTGLNQLTLNGAGDYITTPVISNPGVFSFWYARNGDSSGTPRFTIETSPDNATWTSRGTTGTFNTSYTQFTVNLGALSLTNVYVRIRDTRASNTQQRYIDDISWTSTVAANNLVIPSISNCPQTITCGSSYSFTDSGSYNDAYNNIEDYTITFTPSIVTNKIRLNFSAFATESGYDGMVIYNGPTTASPIISSGLGVGADATRCPAGSYYGNFGAFTVTSTHASGTITIRFRSDNSNRASGWIAAATCVPTCIAPSTQPTLLTLSNISTTSIDGSFTVALPAADKYLVVRSTSATAPSPAPVNGTTYTVGGTIGGATVVSVSNSTTFTASGLTGNTRYYFYIYSYNDLCVGGPLYNTVLPLTNNAITCPAVPNSVTTASITSSSFTLNWTAPTGGSAAAITYNIQITTDAGYTANISGSPFTTSSLTLNTTGLASGTTYYVRILATNGCSSAYVNGSTTTLIANDECSSTIALTVNPTLTCTTSTNGTTIGGTLSQTGCTGTADDDVWYSFTATSTTHDVTVTPGTMNDAVFQVFSGACGSLASLVCRDATAGSSIETSTLTGLTIGNTYLVRVYSYNNGSGNGTFSICITTTPVCTTPTAQPTALTFGTITGNSIDGSFTAASPAPNKYLVVRSTSATAPSPGPVNGTVYTVGSTFSGATVVSVSNATTFSATGLTGTTQYYFYIYSYNDTACAGPVYNTTSPLTGNATTLTPCNAPINIYANILSNTSATVYWVAPTPAPASGYHYYYSTSSAPPTGSTVPSGSTAAGVISVTLTGLTTGLEYYVWVRSNCGGSNTSSWFGPAIFTPCNVGSGSGTTTLECPNIVAGSNGGGGADPTVLCSNTCADLQASYPIIKDTSTYTVSSIPYAPPYQYGCMRNPVSVNVDDVWSNVINLPFEFCFYGTNYSQFLIGSNGNITFDIISNPPGGYNPWSFNTNIPTTSLSLSTIFGVYHDIDPSKGGEIGWELITLDNGCRAMVASWKDVPMYSASCNSILYTGMIVLYENTSIIDVFIKEKSVCSTWNDGNAIVGIQNATGTAAVIAPSRNGLDTDWNTTNEAWRFTPNGASVTSVKWYEGLTASGPVIGTTDVITVCPTDTKTYTAQVTYNLCAGGTLRLTDRTTVNVTGNKTWNGSVNADWDNANNWTPTGVPVVTNCITVPDVAIDPIISGTSYNALGHNLTVNNGAVVNLESTNNLTITDFVNVNTGGIFNVKNSANLVQVNDTAPNSGSINMERTTNVRKTDYVYWSSPVQGFSSAAVSPLTSTGLIFKWNPTIANSNGGFGNWTSGNETMEQGKGYIIRGPGTYSTTVITPYTATFSGAPGNGIIQPAIARGNYTGAPYAGTNGVMITNLDDNWNLIGNPYPSAINATTFLTNNTNIQGSIRVWTHGTNMSTSAGNPFYGTYAYNYTTNDYINYNGTGSTPPGYNGKIAAGQGFFINMLDGAASTSTVTFNNSLRSSAFDNSQFYRQTNDETSDEKHRIWLSLVNSSNIASNTLVGYVSNATNGKDRIFDASHKPTNDLGIYSMIDEDYTIIQGKQLPFDTNDTVQIGVTIPATGIYTVAIDLVDGLFTDSSQNIYLEDTFENVIHDLRQSPYSFTGEAGNFNNRFVLRYTNTSLGNEDFDAQSTFALISNNILEVKSNQNINEVSIFDVSGKLVINYEVNNSKNNLQDNFSYSKGIYIAKIKLENGTIVSKKLMN